MTGDNSYRKGTVDTLIKMFGQRLDRFEGKLDDSIDRQRKIDERLAAGNTRFEVIGDDIKGLKKRDGAVGVLSAVLATIAGIIGSNK